MSLNGLDDPAIHDAYNAAIAEAGGWFLLKYVSRDSVELLARGKSGVHEARNAIAKYEESSPLYGLIIYRRRKVLIKFIPEGTSRLLQARTAVHFQDITERYSPYETLLEITHADGLNDTSLASSFPLHTASPSTSNSRLHEISEDGEDPGSMPRPMRAQSGQGSMFGTRQYKMERRVDQLMRSERPKPPSIHVSSESAPTLSSSLSKPSLSQFIVREEEGKRSITSLTSPSTTSLTEYAGSSAGSDGSTAKETDTIPSTSDLPKASEQPNTDDITTPNAEDPTLYFPEPPTSPPAERLYRLSSQTSDRSVPRSSLPDRPSTSERPKPSASLDEPFDFSYLDPKPKVKLGPRPVAAPERTKRPLAAGIAALPAAYRGQNKNKQQQREHEQESRRKSQSSISGPLSPASVQSGGAIYTPPPIPETHGYDPRPLSCKSLPSQKSGGMTPDKMRLMKAVELRKRKLRKSNPSVQAPDFGEETPEVPQVPGGYTLEHGRDAEAGNEKAEAVQGAGQENALVSAEKADSGIELGHGRREEEFDRSDPSVQQPVGEDAKTESRTEKQEDRAEPEPDPEVSHSLTLAAEDVKEPATTDPPAAETSHTPALEVEDAKASEAINPPAEDEPSRSTPNVSRPERSRSLSSDISSVADAPPAGGSALREEPRQDNGPASRDQSTADPDAGGPTFSTSLEHLITDVPAELKNAPFNTPAPQPQQESLFPPNDQPENAADHSASSSPNETPAPESSDLAKRRRGFVEPLHIEIDKSGHSDAEIGSDDELMEELQSATLHEAKPMAVSKSPGPGAQFFHNGRTSNQSAVSTPSSQLENGAMRRAGAVNGTGNGNGVSQTRDDVHTSRELSQQRSSRGLSQSPEPSTQPVPVRAPSSSLSPTAANDRSTEHLPGLRRNVSNGISQRFQALAEKSSRETSPNAVRIPLRSNTTGEDSMQASATDRRPAALRSPRSRTSSYRNRQRLSTSAAPATPAVDAATQPVWTVHNESSPGGGNRNSVSVRARIVRPATSSSDHNTQQQSDDSTPATSTPGQADQSPALHPSHLEISHGRGIPTPTPVSQAFLPPLPAEDATHDTVDASPASGSAAHRALHSAKRKSWGRSRHHLPSVSSVEDVPLPTSTSNSSLTGAASPVEESGNRTSRWFKRMSNFGGALGGSGHKRKSAAAASLGSLSNGTTGDSVAPSRNGSTVVAEKEEAREAARGRDRGDMPPAVGMGDLNVQFPDALLWKRRNLTLTAHGTLLLTLPSSSSQPSHPPSNTNNPTSSDSVPRARREYPLSSFKAPFLPDSEREELAWSVWLEFVEGEEGLFGDEGGVLQVACEDGMAQRQVLRLVGGYWRSWAG